MVASHSCLVLNPHRSTFTEISLTSRGPGAGGPCYQWTRKEKGKTVSVALSKEQFEAMRDAIANWREVQRTLKRMEQITRENIFHSLPDTKRRKPLTKKVLALS